MNERIQQLIKEARHQAWGDPIDMYGPVENIKGFLRW